MNLPDPLEEREGGRSSQVSSYCFDGEGGPFFFFLTFNEKEALELVTRGLLEICGLHPRVSVTPEDGTQRAHRLQPILKGLLDGWKC